MMTYSLPTPSPHRYDTYYDRPHHSQPEARSHYPVTMPSRPYPAEQQSLSHTKRRSSNASESESRPFLPSISNLLGIADGDRSRHACRMSRRTSNAESRCPRLTSKAVAPRGRAQFPDEYKDRQERYRGPLSPQMTSSEKTQYSGRFIPDATVDQRHHLSSASPIAGPAEASTMRYQSGTLPLYVKNEAQQHSSGTASAKTSPSITSRTHTSSFSTTSAATSPYQGPPSPPVSNGSAPSPADMNAISSAAYGQRPLSVLPSATAVPIPPNQPTSSPWQQHHHHYINSSSQSTFPQSQDRYICPKCQKAFSRPSSLKIHSHSHTGEKPFICAYPGCGKSFSVRSNMRRHERGCHSPPRSA